MGETEGRTGVGVGLEIGGQGCRESEVDNKNKNNSSQRLLNACYAIHGG